MTWDQWLTAGVWALVIIVALIFIKGKDRDYE